MFLLQQTQCSYYTQLNPAHPNPYQLFRTQCSYYSKHNALITPNSIQLIPTHTNSFERNVLITANTMLLLHPTQSSSSQPIPTHSNAMFLLQQTQCSYYTQLNPAHPNPYQLIRTQ